MMGPNGPRPPIEDSVRNLMKGERTLRLVPDSSEEEKMFRKRVEEFDTQLLAAKTEAEDLLRGLTPDNSNFFYINALQVLVKAIDDVAKNRSK